MNAKDMQQLPESELIEHVATTRKEIFGLRFQHATGELENTAGIRTVMRDLARALTIARERDITIPHRT